MRLRRRPSTAESLFDPGKVDLVATGPEGGASLYVVADQPWSGSEAETASLEQKLLSYVEFVLGGQMHELYPELRGESWQIVIDTFVGPPRPDCWERLSALGDAIRERGGDLLVRELEAPEPPETVPVTIRARRVGPEWPEGVPVEL